MTASDVARRRTVAGPPALVLSFAAMAAVGASSAAFTVTLVLSWTIGGSLEALNVALALVPVVGVLYLVFEARLSIEVNNRYTTVLGRFPEVDLVDWKTGVVIAPAGAARPSDLASFAAARKAARRLLVAEGSDTPSRGTSSE